MVGCQGSVPRGWYYHPPVVSCWKGKVEHWAAGLDAPGERVGDPFDFGQWLFVKNAHQVVGDGCNRKWTNEMHLLLSGSLDFSILNHPIRYLSPRLANICDPSESSMSSWFGLGPELTSSILVLFWECKPLSTPMVFFCTLCTSYFDFDPLLEKIISYVKRPQI